MNFKLSLGRLRNLFKTQDEGPEYEVISEGSITGSRRSESRLRDGCDREPFSRYQCFVFFMLGVAMLWAWNMFLAAAPYFHNRFSDSDRILASFQSAIASVSTVANLGSILILATMQSKANYLHRIVFSLLLSITVFICLGVSTRAFSDVSSSSYLVFSLIMVFFSALATALCQNGTFAYISSFGRPEYMQANMVGQAVAGVLPSIAQITAVLAIGPEKPELDLDPSKPNVGSPSMEARKSAFIYFMAAAVVSVLALICMYPLIREQRLAKHARLATSTAALNIMNSDQPNRKMISMFVLYRKLYWIAGAVFMCFAITMFFPVFTARILSNTPASVAPFYLQPQVFIPLGFLTWNFGDLTGRLATSLPFSLQHRPKALFILAIMRVGFIPLYLLCNLDGKGSYVHSDAFYLVFLQFGFGLTNGWLGSSCMMAAGQWVDDSEREATGGFMGVNLVGGLAAGSLLSFVAVKA